MRVFNVLFIIGLMISCTPKEVLVECNTSNPEPNPSFFDVVWQVPLRSDTFEARSITPELYNNQVIYSMFDYSGQNPETFFSRNMETGTLNWEWNDMELSQVVISEAQVQIDNKLILKESNQIFTIDMDSGEKLWNSVPESSGARISNVSDKMYYNHRGFIGGATSGIDPDSSILYRSSANNQKWEAVFTLTKADNDGYAPNILPPTSWIKPNGDTLLLFQNRSFNFPLHIGKIDFYAYNLAQDSVEWVNEDITSSGNSSIYLPIVYDDKVYFQGSNSIHCFDVLTGEEIWNRHLPGQSFLTCNAVLSESKLIVNGDGNEVFALNSETGNTIWNKTNADAANAGNMIYHNGNVYFAAVSDDGYGKLYALRVSDGSTVFAEKSPNRDELGGGASFTAGIAIDPSTNYLYANDRFYFMCIKLPE